MAAAITAARIRSVRMVNAPETAISRNVMASKLIMNPMRKIVVRADVTVRMDGSVKWPDVHTIRKQS